MSESDFEEIKCLGCGDTIVKMFMHEHKCENQSNPPVEEEKK
jgi:hypothetical protein